MQYLTQLDGTQISMKCCLCPWSWEVKLYEYSLECPIDKHVIKALRERWEFDDAGNLIPPPEIVVDEEF